MPSLGTTLLLALILRLTASMPQHQQSHSKMLPLPPQPYFHLIAEHFERSTQLPSDQFQEYDLPVLGRFNKFLRRKQSKRAEESSNADKPRPLRFG
uniref:Uncharacterized protein n=1 Tax=Plectus sambesii TaxID=2011161 RepID=A0A914WZL2_9BILA